MSNPNPVTADKLEVPLAPGDRIFWLPAGMKLEEEVSQVSVNSDWIGAVHGSVLGLSLKRDVEPYRYVRASHVLVYAVERSARNKPSAEFKLLSETEKPSITGEGHPGG